MNDIAKLGLKLFALAAVAGLALGVTNAVTEAPIARQAQLDAEASRSTVLPETAETFALVSEQDGAVTDIYAASDASGALVEKAKDDGEVGHPGRLMLDLLRRDDLEGGLLVSRVFGGVKLGVGGVSRAFREAAEGALAGLRPR